MISLKRQLDSPLVFFFLLWLLLRMAPIFAIVVCCYALYELYTRRAPEQSGLWMPMFMFYMALGLLGVG